MRWFLTLLIPTICFAGPKESLGTLSVSDVLLRPNFAVGSSSVLDRGFNIGESSLAVRWSLNDRFSGTVRVGPRSLIVPPARYTKDVNSDLVMAEAFAQFDHPYGRFRFGRLPLEFGYEGGKSESDLIFPRSFIFSKRVIGLRDIGVSYQIEHNSFFNSLAVHNGEGDSDRDNRLWYTGKWGYKFERAQIGLAGQAGKTTIESTATSEDELASVDENEPAKWRMGGVFAAWNPKRIVLELEAYMGERLQLDGARRFVTGHFDAGYEFSDDLSLFARYDVFDRDTRLSSDGIQRAALALVVNNRSRNSRLIFMAAHDFRENARPNDEFRFIWSLSPAQLPSLF